MKQLFGAVCMSLLGSVLAGPACAADAKDVNAILDKAIKALGGEENLGMLKAATWKFKGTFTIEGNDNKFNGQTTVQGLHHVRQDFEGDFMGNKVKGVTVMNGNKGWRKFGDMTMEMDKDAIANEKRTLYLQMIPMTILPLKHKGFKVQAAGEKKIAGKPAVGIKVTGPDGKDFTLYFDKTSGLPVQQVAKVPDFMGEEFTQETTFSDYKDIGGIKKAMKIVNKRDGQKFVAQTISDFKIVKKVDPKAFAEPK